MDDVSPRDPEPVADRMRLLLGAVHDLGGQGDDDLSSVLRRTVDLACRVTGARYGALGVLAESDPSRLAYFISSGLTEAQRRQIGEPPRAHGILGRLMREPVTVRVADLTREADAVGFPPGHPVMRTFLGMPIRTGPRVFGNLYLTEKAHGQPFSEQDEMMLEGLASLAGVVIDITRQRLEADIQHATVDTVRTINRALLTEDDPERVVPLVSAQAARVTGAELVVVVTPGADGRAPAEVLTAHGSMSAAPEQRDIERPERPQVDALLGDLQHRISQTLTDGVSTHWGEHEQLLLVDQQAGPRHTSIVPARLRDGSQVALVVAGWRPATAVAPRLTEDLIESLGDQVGLVLDRVRSSADHDALLKVGDRERIARDLHDLVIQRIFAAGLTLQGAARLRPEPQVLERIEGTIGELDATIRDIRATIFALRPANPQTPVTAQVGQLVEGYAQNLGFAPGVRFSGAIDEVVDEDNRVALLMVLREALSNVARHAGAGTVLVDLQAQQERLVMTVTDDGVGPPAQVVESGLGNVRQRARQRGGSMDLVAQTPRGTVLRWQVPLRP